MSLAADAGLPPAGTNLQKMDEYIPLAQRQQGLALKAQLARAAGPAPAPRIAVGPRTPPSPNSAIASTLPAGAPGRGAAPRVVAPAPSGGAGGWKVQLGAFGNAGNARAAWNALRAKAPGLGGLSPVLVPAGPVTRLQAGPLASRAAADKACGSAKAAGSACFPVAP
jgi:cell division septation protein DedD